MTSAERASVSSHRSRLGQKHSSLILEALRKISKHSASTSPLRPCGRSRCANTIHAGVLCVMRQNSAEKICQDAVCVGGQPCGAGGSPCSTISGKKRCFSFILAALRMVPHRPRRSTLFSDHFLPTSLWATRKRMIVESPSGIASTETLSDHLPRHELSLLQFCHIR